MNDENKNVSEDQLAEVSGGMKVWSFGRRDLAERGRSYRKTKRKRACTIRRLSKEEEERGIIPS